MVINVLISLLFFSTRGLYKLNPIAVLIPNSDIANNPKIFCSNAEIPKYDLPNVYINIVLDIKPNRLVTILLHKLETIFFIEFSILIPNFLLLI